MKNTHIVLFLILFNLLLAQDIIYDESGKRLRSRKVEAVVGSDIEAAPFTTIILDGSKSNPTDGSLTYEWTFSPNLLFQQDYSFDDFDSMIPYLDSEIKIPDPNGRVSIKKIITRNKYLELEIPNVEPESNFEVILRVQNTLGSHDSDSLIIKVDDPILSGHESAFSDVTIAEDGSSFIVTDEGSEYREPLTETIINSDHFTIQAINKNRLNPMEIRMLNAYIFNHLKSIGIKNILDPNRDIEPRVRVNKLYERLRIEPDTVLVIYNDTLLSKNDRSSYVNAPIDTLFNKREINDSLSVTDTSFIYKRYETITDFDSLRYTEVVDMTLEYKFDCESFDCAAENAFLEQAGQILTWGINEYSEFEFHYFNLEDIYQSDPLGFWDAKPIVFSPSAESELRYPESIAIDADGHIIVVSGNRQSVNELDFSMDPKNVIYPKEILDDIMYPAGVAAGFLDDIYVTDRSGHAVYKIYDGKLSTVYSTPRDSDGLLLEGEPNTPTSIRVDQEGNIVVLFEGDGSVHQFNERGMRKELLSAGLIDMPSDIAISSDGSLYVSSLSKRQIFRVAVDGSVIPIAGTQNSSTTAVDGVTALESYLGEPVSIDFDASNRLYIADNTFGSIRVVATNGIITTLNSIENRIMNIAQLRVSNHNLTTLYATHTLDHRLTRVRYRTISNSSKFDYIHYPYHIIEKDGIYGLEEPINNAIRLVLEDFFPEEKKPSIFKRIADSNRKIGEYFKNRPLLFGLLLILLNQGISTALSDGGAIDLPPDFPF